MQTVFEPSVRPRGGRKKAHGWIKSGTGTGRPGPRAKIFFSPSPAAAEIELLEFYVTECQDEKLPRDRNPAYLDAPGGAFVFDARYLIEHHPSGVREEARANLKALVEAYRWWKKNRLTALVAFFCAAGQNRSVTSAIVFAFSAVADSELAPIGRRASSAPAWSIEVATSNFAEREIYDGSRETLVQFMLRVVHDVRPQAFHKKGAKPRIDEVVAKIWKAARATFVESLSDDKKKLEAARSDLATAAVVEIEPVVDWSRLWIGHAANRQILWTLDAALRSRLYGDWWEGQVWADWKLPPRLESATSSGAKKATARAFGAPDEGDEQIIPL